MSINYFQGTKDHPYHLSVGAVVMNDKNEVCCHYFDKAPGAVFKYGNLEKFYLLMRETIEPNESIEECLARGLQEEFGMKANLKTYIGSLDSHWMTKEGNVKIEKTTLYFLCTPISFNANDRREDDPEKSSVITWIPIFELIAKMKEQGNRLDNSTLDESEILERVKLLHPHI